MTSVFVSMNALTLVISWLGEAAITYTLQTSTNLLDWQSLPFVIAGNASGESHALDHQGRKTFARLRYSADGDTNGNGLPDMWEWEQFGYLDVDPEADADSDGRNNYVEWVDATDPLDFYDGQTPVIRLACGSNWLVPAGQPSQQVLYATVFHPSGEPWTGAPVTIAMESGSPRLLADEEAPGAEVATLVRWTNGNGQLHPDSQPVQVIAPATPGQSDRIRLQAGRATAEVRVHSVGTGLGPPPRQLDRAIMETGDHRYTWSGPPEGASHLLLQERQADGTWTDVALVPASELPPPDPDTGRYSLTLQSPAG